MTDRLLTDAELHMIDLHAAYLAQRGDKVVHNLLADLHRYRDWCRRLVASEGDLDDMFQVMNEVRAAMEDKPC